MKAKLANKSTIVMLDGNYKYTIKRTGEGKDDFRVKKERLEVDDDFDIFDDEEEEKENEDEEEEEE